MRGKFRLHTWPSIIGQKLTPKIVWSLLAGVFQNQKPRKTNTKLKISFRKCNFDLVCPPLWRFRLLSKVSFGVRKTVILKKFCVHLHAFHLIFPQAMTLKIQDLHNIDQKLHAIDQHFTKFFHLFFFYKSKTYKKNTLKSCDHNILEFLAHQP